MLLRTFLPHNYASPVSSGDLSSSFAASVHVSPATPPTKFYAIRRGRVAFPTIVPSWADCSLLVNGYPNAEFKSFRRLADAEEYLFPTEGPSDFAFLAQHTPDPSIPSPTLPVLRAQLAHDAVEGGVNYHSDYSPAWISP